MKAQVPPMAQCWAAAAAAAVDGVVRAIFDVRDTVIAGFVPPSRGR